jgi:uncharacterized caspase-like protein
MSRHRALLVSAGTLEDPRLGQLRSTATDTDALAHVLSDRSISKFEVTQLTDEPVQRLRIALGEFFMDGHNDTLLLYFSCHGLKDQDGELIFATTDTQWKNLRATGVEARWIRQLMKDHRRVVLLLDCCYSGAFSRDMIARGGDGKVDGKEQLEGRGTFILTASDSMEYAFEAGELATQHSKQESFFTRAIVEGPNRWSAHSLEDLAMASACSSLRPSARWTPQASHTHDRPHRGFAESGRLSRVTRTDRAHPDDIPKR